MMPIEPERIIKEYFEGNCDENTAQEISEWLRTPEGNDFLSKMIDKDIDNTGEIVWNDSEEQISSEQIYHKIQTKIIKKQHFRWIVKVAAIFIALIALNVYFFIRNNNYNTGKEFVEVSVPNGEKQQVILQDGTKVWLNAGSRLRFPDNFNRKERRVYLEGEGYFNVSRNEKTPFIVDIVNYLDIKVLGTSFNVKAYADDEMITTTLDEGKVNLKIKGDLHDPMLMTAGEQITFDKKNIKATLSSPRNLAVYSSWLSDSIVFQNTPLAEILKILQRRYDVTFEVIDKEILAYTYTITLKDEQIEPIYLYLQKLTPVKFTKRQGVVEVSKRRKISNNKIKTMII